MAIKKKIAVGLGAVAITAMCFGSTAFAADANQTINGTGSTAVNGSSDVGVTYTKPASGEATWAVNIPQKVDFGSVNDANATVTKSLEYSAVISNTGVTDEAKKVESLEIKLTNPDYKLTDTTHSCTASAAYKFKSTVNTDVTDVIATLKTGEKANINAVLDVTTLKTATGLAASGAHNFTGSFGVTITPTMKQP